MPTSTPDGDGCEGVPTGTGTVVSTSVVGRGFVVGIAVGKVDGRMVGIRSEDGVAGVTGIRTGSPRSMKIVAEDWGFSALMENVRVAVLDDVWKATTARPSLSVVTRA